MTKINTFEELAKVVATEFKKEMQENEFTSFKEMCECYWWDSKDIKEEVAAIISLETNGDAYIDEVDGKDVFMHGTDMMISYREFSRMWHFELR